MSAIIFVAIFFGRLKENNKSFLTSHRFSIISFNEEHHRISSIHSCRMEIYYNLLRSNQYSMARRVNSSKMNDRMSEWGTNLPKKWKITKKKQHKPKHNNQVNLQYIRYCDMIQTMYVYNWDSCCQAKIVHSKSTTRHTVVYIQNSITYWIISIE